MKLSFTAALIWKKNKLKVWKEQIKVLENAENKSVCFIEKKKVIIFFFFVVFIQISFPGLIASVIFLMKGFRHNKRILTILLCFSKVRWQFSTTDVVKWGTWEMFLLVSNQ